MLKGPAAHDSVRWEESGELWESIKTKPPKPFDFESFGTIFASLNPALLNHIRSFFHQKNSTV